MANDEWTGAWLTWHSRQPISSPSPYMVVGLLIFYPYISYPLFHNSVSFKLTVLWSFVESPFWAQRSGKIID